MRASLPLLLKAVLFLYINIKQYHCHVFMLLFLFVIYVSGVVIKIKMFNAGAVKAHKECDKLSMLCLKPAHYLSDIKLRGKYGLSLRLCFKV